MSAEPLKKPKRNIRSRILISRLEQVRQRIAAGWSNPQIYEWAAKDFGVTSRTVDRWMSIVYADAREAMADHKPRIAARLMFQLENFYRTCMKAKRYEAASRYFDRMIRLVGLEQPHKLEVTGKDGKPVEVQRSYKLDGLNDEQLDALDVALAAIGEQPAGETTH